MLVIDGNAVYEIDCDCMKQKNMDYKRMFGDKIREDGPLESDREHLQEVVLRKRYTGRGVGVAILDTGLFPHRDFAGRIRAFQDVISGHTEPWDPNGHGTHVTGSKFEGSLCLCQGVKNGL